ncbi:MAG: cation:proton antiporter [Huintestinicola sp.]|uniref:cation:proton antiporter n=1 Tax=Huintestinicola sp. TaxID=2981661 RepID=UPI003F0FE729
MMIIIKWLAAIVIAFIVGKLVSKLKLPSILGWLITGIVLGPHAFSVISVELMDMPAYQTLIHILECAVGLMIGTELVWNKIKRSGRALIVTTLTQSLGTFALVTIVFSIVFVIMDIPLYIAFIFGGIALATAPAPALSIVNEFKTSGPVTKTLIPMAALDDIVGVAVFFTTISIIARQLSGGAMPMYMIPVMIFLPLMIGAVVGIPTGFLLRKAAGKFSSLAVLIAGIIVTSVIGLFCNKYLMPSPVLNFMLMGMAFSAAFSNMIPDERLAQLTKDFNPILAVSMIIVILNLGAPLDWHAIFSAGLFTFIYIAARAAGKYFGASIGARISGSDEKVRKYLGLTLLPHSGVSLVFTGIAVSVLSASDDGGVQIIQGTIAAAAVINEIIAVIAAKKGFEMAGEIKERREEA